MASPRNRSLVRSTHSTSHPAWRSQAAGDARPNGWRPSSYVLISSARILPIISPSLQSPTPAPRRLVYPAPMALPAARHEMPTVDRAFFGHPRGLSTLFFTEMWERFSYYGMRGFLILYMTAAVAAGGMGFDVATAAAIYGTYTSMVYLMSVPGGWLADRVLGQRKAVFYGGIADRVRPFHARRPDPGGLLYRPGADRARHRSPQTEHQRDRRPAVHAAGHPPRRRLLDLLHGDQPRRVPRPAHHGFPRAGSTLPRHDCGLGLRSELGVALGLRRRRRRHDARAGSVRRVRSASRHGWPGARRRDHAGTRGDVQAASRAVGRCGHRRRSSPSDSWPPPASSRSRRRRCETLAGYSLLAITVVFFAWLFLDRQLDARRARAAVRDLRLLRLAAIFWSVFEQAGSTLNLFADRSTRNELLGFRFPSSWFQSLNALFIIVFAPVFAWLWVGSAQRQPASPDQVRRRPHRRRPRLRHSGPGRRERGAGVLVSPMWLMATYLLHTWPSCV